MRLLAGSEGGGHPRRRALTKQKAATTKTVANLDGGSGGLDKRAPIDLVLENNTLSCGHVVKMAANQVLPKGVGAGAGEGLENGEPAAKAARTEEEADSLPFWREGLTAEAHCGSARRVPERTGNDGNLPPHITLEAEKLNIRMED